MAGLQAAVDTAIPCPLLRSGRSHPAAKYHEEAVAALDDVRRALIRAATGTRAGEVAAHVCTNWTTRLGNDQPGQDWQAHSVGGIEALDRLTGRPTRLIRFRQMRLAGTITVRLAQSTDIGPSTRSASTKVGGRSLPRPAPRHDPESSAGKPPKSHALIPKLPREVWACTSGITPATLECSGTPIETATRTANGLPTPA